jgi:HKD family nuclease
VLRFSRQPELGSRLGDFLERNLKSPRWTEFRAAIAFAKRSGTRHVASDLKAFIGRGRARIAVGVDVGGTSSEGLNDLLNAVGDRGEIWVFHNEGSSTFHPKVYAFTDGNAAEVYVGSGNLTGGGLFTNYEAGFEASLNLGSEEDRRIYANVVAALDSWSSAANGTGQRLTPELLARLVALGYVIPEAEARSEDEASAAPSKGGLRTERERLFKSVAVPGAPKPAPSAVGELRLVRRPAAGRGPVAVAIGSARAPMGFVMTLQQTDVGVGQVTKGTSRRSPEIFIPLAARDVAPDFWGYPGKFAKDPTKRGKMDRMGVRMRIGGGVTAVNMMTWPDKHDFRLRSEALRSAGKVGDILRLEKASAGSGFDYYAEVIPQGTSQYPRFHSLCTTPVKNSKKAFGYY